jgi:TPP-dependent pyruvate/acetoin dehydrogenase alpha subunit
MTTLDPERARRMYTDMWRIRLFEEEANRQAGLGKVVGTLHMYCGQEAVAVSVADHLRSDDYIVGNHRSHGHCLAKGAPMDGMMAELFGRSTGICGGKGGSMHVADFSINILGANGIVGGGIGPATGTALASKMRRTGQVSVCFFGDGGSARGTFHEAMIFGSLWKLPIVYVCENNGYQQWVARSRVAPVDSVADLAGGYGMPTVRVDGQDAAAVHAAAGAAIARARAGDGPSLIEARTYRYYGHSLGDREEYRSREEVETWRRDRDPIILFGAWLAERQWLTERDDADIREAVRRELEGAVAFADSSPFPQPDALMRDVVDDAWAAAGPSIAATGVAP